MRGRPRVVIALGDGLVRDVLRLACERAHIEVVGEATAFPVLLDVCRAEQPGVALTTDRLGGEPLESALPKLLEAGVEVVVLAADASLEQLGSLLALGVSGYFSHTSEPDDVARGILAVTRGEIALGSAVVTTVLAQWREMRSIPLPLGTKRRPLVTPRELDVLRAMADGLSAKAIAERLGLAIKTVENHKIRIFQKLGVRTQAHAVTVALAYGVLNAPGPSAPAGDVPDP